MFPLSAFWRGFGGWRPQNESNTIPTFKRHNKQRNDVICRIARENQSTRVGARLVVGNKKATDTLVIFHLFSGADEQG